MWVCNSLFLLNSALPLKDRRIEGKLCKEKYSYEKRKLLRPCESRWKTVMVTNKPRYDERF